MLFADEDLPSKITSRFNFTERDLDRRVDFNIRGDDVMVFLHIQKTGGTTFGRHLVKNIQLEQPCDCLAGQRKCTCHRPGKAESWLFSRFSTGWSCGLHADWTELTSCVPVVMNKRDKMNTPKMDPFAQLIWSRLWLFHSFIHSCFNCFLNRQIHSTSYILLVLRHTITLESLIHCVNKPNNEIEIKSAYSSIQVSHSLSDICMQQGTD
uniref:Heparan-sulfate 6-O-sulfotransferase n=1 Tax=Neolamprologus brichardi TaxID=32507 RepID=A0A3Q4HXM9_NEOBR